MKNANIPARCNELPHGQGMDSKLTQQGVGASPPAGLTCRCRGPVESFDESLSSRCNRKQWDGFCLECCASVQALSAGCAVVRCSDRGPNLATNTLPSTCRTADRCRQVDNADAENVVALVTKICCGCFCSIAQSGWCPGWSLIWTTCPRFRTSTERLRHRQWPPRCST
jgi:hypothetical protein